MNSTPQQCVRITLTGAVQGVGMRPFLFRLANSVKISGWVKNHAQGVICQVQGTAPTIDVFLRRLHSELPAAADIERQHIDYLPFEPLAERDFQILPSDQTDKASAAAVNLPPDLAVCDACVSEILDPDNRRYRYPFTSCTQCGPRWSIANSPIYDRANTAMAEFQLCEQCLQEYRDPHSRRFHHQANACPRCGPQLQLLSTDGAALAVKQDAMQQSVAAINAGKIIALQGIGGFQLIVDANNNHAVAELRRRKHRLHKPLAVMVKDLAAAETLCVINTQAQALLCSAAAPIVLLPTKPESGQHIAANVAPANPRLGVMLAYSPVHRLLLEAVDKPLVVTSGNLSGEPLCVNHQQALEKLSGIADLLLVHNRAIVQALDDSVVQVACDKPMVLRRARGYVPGLFTRDVALPGCLALGSYLKNTLAAVRQQAIFLGPHIGDLDTVAAREEHQSQQQRLQSRYHCAVVAGDRHPLAQPADISVQHHHAHIVAAMIEHHIQQPVLGIAWDGFGWGDDGTAWGGEWLMASATQYRRVASLRPFSLPGNDYAATETGRAALACVYEACLGTGREALQVLQLAADPKYPLLMQVLEKQLNTTVCSSVGRLFDAVAFILELAQANHFEGQAAMAVQYAAESARQPGRHLALQPMRIIEVDSLPQVDWRGTLLDMIRHKQSGAAASELAWLFHRALVDATIELIHVLIAQYHAPETIVVSGGCFQNRLLLELLVSALREQNLDVYWPQQIPPNDGGIAAGQAVIAAGQWQQRDYISTNATTNTTTSEDNYLCV